MEDIATRLQRVKQRITDAERAYAREPGSVQLIAVSKTKPSAILKQAIDAGQRVFGESYLQEALVKQQELRDYDLEWHFVGPIQSNKTRQISASFDWVHGVDREKIARRLSEQRPDDMPVLNICMQVNISGESSKSGVSFTELKALAQQVIELPRIKLRGLMALPQRSTEFEAQRAAFAKLAKAKRQLASELGLDLDTLSMGMSGDLEAAIAEGASFVRVGTDIFGERDAN